MLLLLPPSHWLHAVAVATLPLVACCCCCHPPSGCMLLLLPPSHWLHAVAVATLPLVACCCCCHPPTGCMLLLLPPSLWDWTFLTRPESLNEWFNNMTKTRTQMPDIRRRDVMLGYWNEAEIDETTLGGINWIDSARNTNLFTADSQADERDAFDGLAPQHSQLRWSRILNYVLQTRHEPSKDNKLFVLQTYKAWTFQRQ